MEWEEEILANSKLNMGCFKTALANCLWAKSSLLSGFVQDSYECVYIFKWLGGKIKTSIMLVGKKEEEEYSQYDNCIKFKFRYLLVKFYCNGHAHCVYIISGCCHTATAELNACDRDYRA